MAAKKAAWTDAKNRGEGIAARAVAIGKLKPAAVTALARRVAKARNWAELSNALEGAATNAAVDAGALAWELVRARLVPDEKLSIAIVSLLDGKGHARPPDVAALLARAVKLKAEDGRTNDELVAGWPDALDGLVMAKYAEDRAPFDAIAASLPKAHRDGLALVARRYGGPAIDDALARAVAISCATGRWPGRVMVARSGGPEVIRLGQHVGEPAVDPTDLDELVRALFGDVERFARLVYELQTSRDVKLAHLTPEYMPRAVSLTLAWVARHRSPDEVAAFCSDDHIPDAASLAVVHDALVRSARCSGQTLAQIARSIPEVGVQCWLRLRVAWCAVLATTAAREVPAAALDALLSASFVDIDEKSSALLAEALGALGPGRASAILARDFDGEGALRVVRHVRAVAEPAVLERAVHAVVALAREARASGDRHRADAARSDSSGACRAVDFVLTDLGRHVGPAGGVLAAPLARAHDAADDPVTKDVLQAAVVFCLARLADDGGIATPELDRFLGLTSTFEDPYPDAFRRALTALPDDRRASVIEHALADERSFARAFHFLELAPEPTLRRALDALGDARDLAAEALDVISAGVRRLDALPEARARIAPHVRRIDEAGLARPTREALVNGLWSHRREVGLDG